MKVPIECEPAYVRWEGCRKVEIYFSRMVASLCTVFLVAIIVAIVASIWGYVVSLASVATGSVIGSYVGVILAQSNGAQGREKEAFNQFQNCSQQYFQRNPEATWSVTEKSPPQSFARVRQVLAKLAFAGAAKAGDSRAALRLGQTEEMKGNLEDAKRWYKEAADAGDLMAMYNLGRLVEASDGQSAIDWYSQAAKGGEGDAMAMSNLGRLLKDSDPDGAIYWYDKAARKGDAMAMVGLGLLLETREDWDGAIYWYDKAAHEGDVMGMVGLGRLLKERDPKGSRYWYERAAECGDAFAAQELGHQPAQ